MSDERYDDINEDEDVPRRPRTMKRAVEEDETEEVPRRRQVVDETEEDEAPPRRRRVVSDDDGEDEAPAPRRNKAPAPSGDALIRGGWTDGQKVMDSASSYAQAFTPNQNVQVIKFLEDAPYANYRRHWIDRIVPGKGATKRPYICLESVGKECPLCAIGDKAQAVSAFNVALVGDDGQVLLKSWDVGAKLFNTLQAFAKDPKVGPLTKNFFAVSKSGKGGTTSWNVLPTRARDLAEDYDIDPPTEDELDAIGLYDPSILQIPKRSELEELAEELADD